MRLSNSIFSETELIELFVNYILKEKALSEKTVLVLSLFLAFRSFILVYYISMK